MSVPNLSSAACLGARLENVTCARTYTSTDRQTPGEYSANSGPAQLGPGPELSNLHNEFYSIRGCSSSCMAKNSFLLKHGIVYSLLAANSLIFIFINYYQLSSAVLSCWQLMTADMKKKSTGIFMYTWLIILNPIGIVLTASSFVVCTWGYICIQYLKGNYKIADKSWGAQSRLYSKAPKILRKRNLSLLCQTAIHQFSKPNIIH